LDRRPEEAQAHLDRATRLLPREDNQREANAATWVELAPMRAAWLAGRIPEAIRELQRFEQSSRATSEQKFFASAWIRTMFGQLRLAEESFRPMKEEGWREDGLTSVAFFRDDTLALRDRLRRFHRNTGSFLLAGLMIHAGLVDEAEAAMQKFEAGTGATVTLRGYLALARGHEKGKEVIERQLANVGLGWHPVRLLAAESLARTYDRQGSIVDAIKTLEHFSAGPDRLWTPNGNGSFAFWLRVRAQLAQLYRKAGRIQDAQDLENYLRNLLQDADDDHPIKVQLLRLQGRQ
jgi:hypothetical protein